MEIDNSQHKIIQASIRGTQFKKGQYITPEEVERYSLCGRDDRRYSIALLNLKSIIEKWFEDRGVTPTIKTETDGLRILTDIEATTYNHELFKQRVRSLFFVHDRAQSIDTGQMSEEQRKDHDKRLVSQGRFIQAIMQENRAVKLIPYRRPLNNNGENNA